MKVEKIRCLLLIIMSFFVVHYGYAQDISIKGQVFDQTLGEPMIGVNVSVKGTTNGVITDFDGNFIIKAKKNDVLVFSFIGYKDVVVVVKPGLNLSKVLMSEDTQQIEEVIVVGYGQQKKASSVGAISSTKGTDLLQVGSVTTVSEALQGQIPGVMAINTSSKPGDDAADLFIRGKATWGSASPLVLVDGIERNFNDVDVNEIESISVLKDASATAVYGVKGANGVILLTTKRGKNEKPVVNFSANFGFKQPTVDLDFADYITSMKMYNEAVTNDKDWTKLIPESTISAWENAYRTGNYGPYNDYFPEVDWWNEMVKDFGFQQNYNLNISGGTERMSYFASLGYLNDGDIYNIQKNDEFDPRFYYKRYNWRTNFDFNITKSTKLSVNIAGNMGYRNQPGYRDADSGDSYIFDPFLKNETNTFPIKYSDGVWGSNHQGEGNIVAQMNHQGQRQYKTFQGFYDVMLNQKLDMITKGLSFKASVSYTSSSTRQSKLFKAGIYDAANNDASASNLAIVRYYRQYDYSKPIINEDGTVTYELINEVIIPNSESDLDLPMGVSYDNFSAYNRKLYYELALNYARKFGNHDVTALALFNRKITENKANFPSYEEDWVGRVTYNWKERYLAEVNAAYTGSEKFAPGKRFGFFPSFSVGWRITEENFMKSLRDSWLTNLKIRYSWGKVGSDLNANAFNYIQTYESGGNVTFGKYDDVSFGPLYTEGALAYANATWETAIKQNLGLDITLFRNLKMTIDLFNEKRTGILMTRQTIAPWMGVELPSVNIGETKNHGMELDLTWNDNIGKDFNYYVKFNFSTSENRVVFKDDPNKLDEYLKAAGKPIGADGLLKYIAVGNLSSIDDIFNYSTSIVNNGTQDRLVPGDLVYIDYNSDGVIDSKDKAPVSHVNYPLTSYGLTLGFDYKGFGVNAQFYAATGVYKEQIGNLLWDFPNSIVKAQPNTLDRWTEEDANSTAIVRPSVHLTNTYNSQQSTFTYTNHSYLRLKNLEINYSLPKQWIKVAGLSKCQIYVNGNNLFTISKVDKRRDPETGSGSVYPIVRRFNVGARLSF